ncbi:Translationally-controlled tumor protein [Intoshia linei]|uniref:Translationally-controlled tumor protein n=1 Tax=Intoshia linei TaxID=1819745 RepID=A0A177AWZ8_9BILA|nr:Translationally-controlled tumor protein [Intoshia linei]
MKLYTCQISKDEMLTDSHNIQETEVDGMVKVKAEYINVSGGIDDRLIGNVASAECDDEAAADQDERVLNIVSAHSLTRVDMDKKIFKSYFKNYLKRLVEVVGDAADADFKKRCTNYYSFVSKNIDELYFYMGESEDPDAFLVPCWYKAENDIVLYYITHVSSPKGAYAEESITKYDYQKKLQNEKTKKETNDRWSMVLDSGYIKPDQNT